MFCCNCHFPSPPLLFQSVSKASFLCYSEMLRITFSLSKAVFKISDILRCRSSGSDARISVRKRHQSVSWHCCWLFMCVFICVNALRNAEQLSSRPIRSLFIGSIRLLFFIQRSSHHISIRPHCLWFALWCESPPWKSHKCVTVE